MNKLITAAETCELIKKRKEQYEIDLANQVIHSLSWDGKRTYRPGSNKYDVFPSDKTLSILKDLGYKIEYGEELVDIFEKQTSHTFLQKLFLIKPQTVEILKEKKLFKTLTISACCDSVPRPEVD